MNRYNISEITMARGDIPTRERDETIIRLASPPGSGRPQVWDKSGTKMGKEEADEAGNRQT